MNCSFLALNTSASYLQNDIITFFVVISIPFLTIPSSLFSSYLY